MRLAGGFPRCTPEFRNRLELALERDACGYGCQATLASLRRRRVSSYYTVQLQCTGCGRGVGSALPKLGCFDSEVLDHWDEELAADWTASWLGRAAESAATRQTQLEDRRIDYREWLRISPEWKALRGKVLKRANWVCEGCLEADARDVHHETYAMGRLPPAMYLHALCRPCHDLMHGR